MTKKFEKPEDTILQKKLTPMQYKVTQHEGTEPPFQNEYWNNHADGIYVDVVTGEPLFSSRDKFDSGTGWPSFTKPLEPEQVTSQEDRKLLMSRTEVRSKEGNSHLGHVFDDGPGPTGQRFCINSAALRFIPVDKLAVEGYGQYAGLFAASAKSPAKASTEVATVAGGCFWGVEDLIRQLTGVISTEVGYTGGALKNPSYEDVTSGKTGHAEAVEIKFDPARIGYAEILNYFFRLHDPTTLNRQAGDRGTQYRSAVFYHSEEQKKIAEEVKAQVGRAGKWEDRVVTEITKAGPFYKAEDYHQDYLQKNPDGYHCHYLRD